MNIDKYINIHYIIIASQDSTRRRLLRVVFFTSYVKSRKVFIDFFISSLISTD